MGNRLQIIKALYGEGKLDNLSEGSSSSDARSEFAALAQVKEVLDRRPRQTPNESVIDAIVQEARQQVSVEEKRPPLTLVVSALQSNQMVRWAMAACVLFVAVAIGLNTLQPDPSLKMSDADTAIGEEGVAAFRDDAALAARAGSEVVEQDTGRRNIPEESSDSLAPIMAAPPTDAIAVGVSSDDSELNAADAFAWEESSEFRSLRNRIEMLDLGTDELNWDAAVVPLEALPGSNVRARRVPLQQAGSDNNR